MKLRSLTQTVKEPKTCEILQLEPRESVLPIFDDAELHLDVVRTEYKGHALELIKNYDLTTLQGIVCVGGDGTVHEVINGLMRRPDWRNAIKMPICPIPCGSGNALAKTALQEAGEEYSVVNSALMAVLGAYVPFDIALAETKTEKLYFFMSFSWGMIADSDIESEKLRFLGEIRFTLAGIKCCMINKVYHGILQYLPYREYIVQSVDDSTGLESFRDMLSGEESVRMKPMMGVICPQRQLPDTNTPQTSAGPIEEPEVPNANLLEPFEHQLSGDWVTIDSLFTIFNPTLLPYLTRSMKIAPSHAMGGGYITLVMARGGQTRIAILQAMRDWEKERHSDVEIIKVEAFRFIPQDLDGVYSIDGEVYPVQIFQAQVLKQLGRIMCRKVRDRNTVKMTENVLS
ncbi:Sphingosine kinase 2 [Oopsacas minuta]|uniref:Sphingosine kinase 2 n=1 Tax=Oopsacas minuta TaxID=111878 RepID=A0AAV7JFF2_9METZ|nr:Sphingosine kinase 2 [Oopsacas minuta]